MIEVVAEIEDPPLTVPEVVHRYAARDAAPTDDPAASVPPEVTWARIEQWTCHRWTPRGVEWRIEADAPGEWVPRLTPFGLGELARWEDAAWRVVVPVAGPRGGYVLDPGIWRARGEAGAGASATPPAAVVEAFQRLHEYHLGVARCWWTESATYATEGRQAPVGWPAKAIHLSGAADLLRPWRGLGR